MAAPHEQPWSNAEKVQDLDDEACVAATLTTRLQNYLLAEIIKNYSPPAHVLLNVVTQLGIQPNWSETPLPPGRSPKSSQTAFNELRQTYPTTLSMPTGGFGPQTPSPMSAPVQLKRQFPFESTYSGREIRPKPSSISSAYSQTSPVEQPPRKKRGRPTKAEAQAKAEAQMTGGETYAGPAPPPELSRPLEPGPQISQTPEAPTIFQPSPEETRPALPPVSRVPISSIVTPVTTKSEDQSSSSSGKRRRGRSMRSEAEDFSGAVEAERRQVQEYESPYAGTADEPYSGPPRSTILSHRNGRETESQQPRAPERQEYGAQAPPRHSPPPPQPSPPPTTRTERETE